MIPNFQSAFLLMRLTRHEQVPRILIVDLKHAELHLEVDPLPFLGLDLLEDEVCEHWDDAPVDAVTEHGVALPAARLPVGKQRGVVAFPGVFQDGLAEVVEDHILVGVFLIGGSEVAARPAYH